MYQTSPQPNKSTIIGQVVHRLSTAKLMSIVAFTVLFFGLFVSLADAQVAQEGFRFRFDDGSESGATWLAPQDANIVWGLDETLRFRGLIDVTGTGTTTRPSLQFKKSTESTWHGVGIDDSYPTIMSTSSGRSTGDLTDHAITLPSGVTAGDLLLVVFSMDGRRELNIDSNGWGKLGDEKDGVQATGAVFWKFATGVDTATVTIPFAEEASYIAYRIQNAGAPFATVTNNSSTNTDPPLITMDAVRPYLFLATRSGDAQVVASALPSGYSNLNSIAANTAAGASTNVAQKFATASSEDPGTYTSATENWVSHTIAIPSAHTPSVGSLKAQVSQALSSTNNTSYGSIAWSGYQNGTTNDSSTPNVTTTGTTASNYLVVDGLQFDIPENATIVGVQAFVDKQRNSGATGEVEDNSVRLFVNGVATGTNMALAGSWDTVYLNYEYGGITDTWGTALTPAMVNSNNFGIGLAVQGNVGGADRQANIDYMQMNVYYTVDGPVVLSASSNITASGASTTVQLTSPAGKNSGDFDAGRIQDDENPSDTIVISNDDYAEMEWSIEFSGATRGEVYDLRMGIGTSTALASYAVNPQVTIGTYQPPFAQEGHRFRNDNGSESSATWLGLQDTNVTWPTNSNLRFRGLVNSSSTARTEQLALQYKKSTDGSWHTLAEDDSFPTIMATSSGASVGAVTNHTITLPSGVVEDDLLIVIFSCLSINCNTTPSSAGWNKWHDQAESNSHNTDVYWKRATTSDASVTFTTLAADTSAYVAYRVSGAGDPVLQALEGTTADPDFPLLTTDGQRKYLWIAARSYDASGAVGLLRRPSAGYSGLILKQADGVNGEHGVETMHRYLEAVSEQPESVPALASFWITYTMAIPPKETPTKGSLRTQFDSNPVGSEDNSFGTLAWSGVTNIIDEDASYASFTASGVTSSRYLEANAFGFSIPLQATIVGIEAAVKTYSNGGTTGEIQDSSVRLVKAGSVIGSNLAAGTIFNNPQYINYGSSTALWGTTWTPAEINASDFGLMFSAKGVASGANRIGNVDHLYLKVYYTLPPPIVLAPSSNITASGENTTAKLTAPSGKSTSDFDVGRIQDDENPADTVTISESDYSEFEWSIMATGTATTSEVYQVRLGQSSSTALSSYDTSASFTIGTYSAPSSIAQEGFRFRNDDGSETTATWKAAQDTSITADVNQNVRLRTLVDLTSTSTVSQLGLQYKISSSSVWKSVGVDDAFPVIQATSSGRSNVNTTAHVITMPSGVQVGDLLMVLISLDTAAGTSTLNQPAGWERFAVDYNGDLTTGAVYWQIATTTSPVLTITSGTSEESTHIVYRISGAGTPVAFSADGSGTNSNPPNLVTSGARDYLSIVTRSGDTSAGTNTAATVAPSGYSGLITQFASTTNGANSNTAHRYITASSTHDPATFTSATEQWVSYTIAIPPAETPTTNTVRASYQTALTGNNNTSAGSIAWTNPGNSSSSDNVFAQLTVSSTTASNYLVASTSGGLNIPTSATITGIEVHIERHRFGGSAGEIRDNTAQLMRNGALVGSNIAVTTNWGTGDRQMQYGSSTALWNTTWTPADFNNGNFGFAFAVQGVANGANRIARVDQIVAHVYYTIPSSIEFGASSNIAASGASTTAQLSAPTGKNTGDFDQGRIQDDENPTDSIAISTDDYTELEWSLVATGTASNGEVYDFRVGFGTSSVTALTEYLETPQWTIGAPPAAPTILLSGTLYNDQGVTPRTGVHTITLAVGTTTPSTQSTTTVSANGAFSFSVDTTSLLSSTTYTFFVDASTTVRAALVYQASSTNSVSGLNLYKDHVIARSATTSQMTMTPFALYDFENDSDLQFSATTTSTSTNQDQLNIRGNQTFYVWPGTSLRAAASSTFSGSFDNDGIYNATSGQFAFLTGTGRGLDGTLTGSSSLGSVTIIGSYVSSSTVASTSELTIASGGSFTAPATALTTGDLTNSGTFSDNGGTLNLSGQGYFSNQVTPVDTFSVSGQETSPMGLEFNSDGTKLYVIGSSGDDITEYNLSTPWDVSTGSFVDTFSVAGQDTAPSGLAFNPNGTKLYVLGDFGNDINEYNLSTPWDVSTGSFVDTFSVAAQETFPMDLAFNPDGTKLYVSGEAGFDINEYNLSTPWDVSTGSFVDTFSVAAQDSYPSGIAFNALGTELYVSGVEFARVVKYTLATPWDVSTGSFVRNLSVSSQEGAPTGLAFNPDGTNLYVIGVSGVEINEYRVSGELAGTLTGTSDLGTIIASAGTTTLPMNASTTNLTINSGATLIASSSLGVSGDFTINGNFRAATSTVYLTGTTQTIQNNATTSFFNLTKNVTSSSTLTFGAGDEFETRGTLTLNGTAGNLLSLRSTSPGTQYYIDPYATATVSYLNVQDSRNISVTTTPISCLTGCVDSGNTTNWSYVAVPDLVLGEHEDGQPSNVFSFQNQNDVAIFAFSLTPSATTTISSLTLRVSDISNRVSTSSIPDLRLYRDINSNSLLDGGDVQVGGTGVFATSSATQGTIVFSTSFISSTTQNFIVTSDTVDIDKREALVLKLYPADIIGSANVSGAVSQVYHNRESNTGSSGGGSSASIGGAPPAGQGVQTGGGEEGGGEAGQETDGENIAPNPNFLRPSAQSGGWTNGGNALVSDNTRAQAPSATTHVFNGFGFAIPVTNTIVGIEVKLDSRYSNQAGTIAVDLSWNTGSNYTSTKLTPTLANTDAVYTLGGPTDAWGHSWTPAEFSDATLRVRVLSSIADLQLDGIEVRVYHQATGGGGGGGGAI